MFPVQPLPPLQRDNTQCFITAKVYNHWHNMNKTNSQHQQDTWLMDTINQHIPLT